MSERELADMIMKPSPHILFHYYAYDDNFQELSTLLEQDAVDVHQRDRVGRNALHWAVIGNSVRNVKLLREKGCDSTVKDFWNHTPAEYVNLKCETTIMKAMGN